MTRVHAFHTSAALLLLALASSCSSTGRNGEGVTRLEAPDKYVPGRVQAEDPTIGQLLATVNNDAETWSQLIMSARSEADRRKARGIELHLMRITKPRLSELVEQLETGPPINRMRAATALGFTKQIEAQSPLLAALYDLDANVVSHSLISLGNLQFSDTPLQEICRIAQEDPDAVVRSNATRAMLWILDAGGTGDCALGTAQLGLEDPEPGVRAQSALVLGILKDDSSVGRLADRIHDEHALVARAALKSLEAIAARVDASRGDAVRALVGAWQEADGSRQGMIRRTLNSVNGADLGDDPLLWLEWAQNMP